MLTDAKQEDEKKRATLYKFYEDTEVCLNSMDDTICRLLEQDIPNYKDKIASHKKNLEMKKNIVLVAGLFNGFTFLRFIMMICSSRKTSFNSSLLFFFFVIPSISKRLFFRL